MAKTFIPDSNPDPVAVPAPSLSTMHHEGPLLRNFRAMLMVWRRDIIRLFRMPTRIITGIAQPILFLFVLGAGLESADSSVQAVVHGRFAPAVTPYEQPLSRAQS